jgi:serine/threonine protein phosphatase PrpC
VLFALSGDHAIKAVGVIAEPEVTIFELQTTDKFMIMASDGVWEFITSQVT